MRLLKSIVVIRHKFNRIFFVGIPKKRLSKTMYTIYKILRCAIQMGHKYESDIARKDIEQLMEKHLRINELD